MLRVSRYILLTSLFIIIAPTLAQNLSEKETTAWLHQALALQRDIDVDAPMNETTFIGTHNSYNAKVYQTAFRYIDPNQKLSVYDQLEAGVRSLEFDVHWTLNKKFSKEILLCHASPTHTGCSIFDRKLKEGLKELADWLKIHPKEIVLLYLERHLDGHEKELHAQLEKYLAPYTFKPTMIKNAKLTPHCKTLPSDLTKAEILKEGKQLIIVTKYCSDKNPFSSTPNCYDMMFAGSGSIQDKHYQYSFIDALVENFKPYPHCGISVFKSDVRHTSLWRIFDDRTVLSNKKVKLDAKEMRQLMQCGINWPALDMLEKNDNRLFASVWSWAPSYPTKHLAGKDQCALFQSDEGLKDASCDSTTNGFLCKDKISGNFNIAINGLMWSEGVNLCQRAFGPSWHFAVPINGRQAETTKKLMQLHSVNTIWLNYATDQHGKWVPNILKAQG